MSKTFAISGTIVAVTLAAVAGVIGDRAANAQSDAADDTRNRPWTQTDRPDSERLPLGEIEARLAAEGLEIDELDREGRIVEVKARDAQGRWYEIDVDAFTGEIVRTEEDDD